MDADTRRQLANNGPEIASFKTGGRRQSTVKPRMMSLKESYGTRENLLSVHRVTDPGNGVA